MYQKSKKEQKIHIGMLYDVKRILDNMKIVNILSGSALLGIKRAGKPVPWCEGMVLIVKYDQVRKRGKQIIKALQGKGFVIKKYFKSANKWKIRAHKGKLNIEIVGYYKNMKYYIRRKTLNVRRIPVKFIDQLGKIKLNGIKYNCPRDVIGYLKWVYGKNWRTPVISKTPGTYHSKRFVSRI